MPDKNRIADVLARTRTYLTDVLLPFWTAKSPDPACGGFRTYFDADGNKTGETEKTFLMQIRMLYTMASAHRAGYGHGACAELAQMGAAFIMDHYWDAEHDGWFWIADRQGAPVSRAKVGYGQVFSIYAFSEYFLATHDPRGREAAERSYNAVCRHMADTRHGGYLEIMQPDWRPAPSGREGATARAWMCTCT